MLTTLDQNVKASYVHDYGQSELKILKNDTTKLGLAIADSTAHLLVPDDPGVGGVLKINLYSYHKTGRTGKRGSYAKKKRHDRAYLLNKRRQVKKDFELFQAESPDRLCTGVLHFDSLKQCPKSPHTALDKVFSWLDTNYYYLDPHKFCGWAEYGDNKCVHVHFLACLKSGLKFDTNSHNSRLVKAIQSSWSYGYAEITPQPYQLERLANYWVVIPGSDQKPYGELSDAQMVALRDSIAHEINQLKLVQSPKVKGKIEELKDHKKEVQKQIKQGRAIWYPNNNKDNPYRSSLSGFQSKKLNVTTSQAKALAKLGKFSHAKLSAKALTNVNPSTGEISNGPVLATVSLFLKLSPEEVKQALVLQKSGEVR